MFVNLTPSQVGVLAGGPSGVFQLDKNDTLHSMNKENARLPSEVQKYFGLKLSEFKSHINR
jgi:nitrogen fixation/metabolism regulation signal transduction histidine kinase